MDLEWINAPGAELNKQAKKDAEARQMQLTKPPGALGQLEYLVIQLASMQDSTLPHVDNVWISIFAGDHGVAAEGVSAFPQSVTCEMIKNFSRGGAAINVLANELGATLEVINMGTADNTATTPSPEAPPLDNVIQVNLGPGTKNITQSAAMTESQYLSAIETGKLSVERALSANAHIYIAGEMGIANTTSATAIACALMDILPEKLTGPGTGLDKAGVEHKINIIQKALALHMNHNLDCAEILRRLGGFEIAAMTGAYIACAKKGVPILVDGFISSVAALCASHLCDDMSNWFLFSHISAEPGHVHVLEALGAKPILNLGMRLGEGSGAAVAVPILRLACALHRDMATFDEAEVKEKIPEQTDGTSD